MTPPTHENIQFDVLQGNLEVNLGSILENIMAQAIKGNGYDLHYYDSKKIGEIDFVIQNGTKVDVLEIKSGNDFKKHPAINKITEIPSWNFEQVLVFCKGNVEKDGDVVYLPWYMIMFYKPEQVLQSQIFEVDLSGL